MFHWLKAQWSRSIQTLKPLPKEERVKKKKMKKERKERKKAKKKKNKHQEDVNINVNSSITQSSSSGDIPLNEYIGLIYRLTRMEDFDVYMQKLGVNFFKRKIAMKMMPTHFILDFASGKYILKYFSKLVQIEQQFRLDEETEERIVDGRFCKILFKYHPPDTLIETQQSMNMVNVIKRVFSLDTVYTTLCYDSCVSKMIFTRSYFHGQSRSPSFTSSNYIV